MAEIGVRKNDVDNIFDYFDNYLNGFCSFGYSKRESEI